MIDVIERLQKAETRPLDADGKTQLWETLQDARAEIARLRDALDEQTGRAAWHYECLTQCEEEVIQRDAEIERLRLTDAEREAVDKMRVHLYEISRDNAFIDEVCDDAKAACEAIAAFLERHKQATEHARSTAANAGGGNYERRE